MKPLIPLTVNIILHLSAGALAIMAILYAHDARRSSHFRDAVMALGIVVAAMVGLGLIVNVTHVVQVGIK